MKNNIIIQLFLALCVCCACSSDNDQHIDPIPGGDDLVQIKPTTKFFTPNNSETRTEGVIDKKTDIAINTSFFRIDGTTGGVFPTDWPASPSIISATISNPNLTTWDRMVTFTSTPQYYDGDKMTRLIAVYPAITSTGVTCTSALGVVTVTQTVNGRTDIMATPIVECSRTGVPGQPSMEFKHLLTQIEVSVIATDEQASTVWGTINSITLKDSESTCKIELPAPNATNLSNPTVSFTPTGNDLILWNKDGSATGVIELEKDVSKVFGYCMFPPVASTLSLLVVTEKKGTVSVTVPTGTYIASRYYKIQLSLTATSIVPTVTIAEWEKGTLTPIEVTL